MSLTYCPRSFVSSGGGPGGGSGLFGATGTTTTGEDAFFVFSMADIRAAASAAFFFAAAAASDTAGGGVASITGVLVASCTSSFLLVGLALRLLLPLLCSLARSSNLLLREEDRSLITLFVYKYSQSGETCKKVKISDNSVTQA